MRIGQLDERITVEEEQTVPDGSGGQTVTWQSHVELFANVRPVRLSEEERQGAVRASRGYLFTIRRRDDLEETMRISWRGEVFNIREIRLPRARVPHMEIFAQSGVTQ